MTLKVKSRLKLQFNIILELMLQIHSADVNVQSSDYVGYIQVILQINV